MARRAGLFILAGVLSVAAVTGCASQGRFNLREFARREGFSLSGRSERPLQSILGVFRELEADDRPL
ncbi:MAG: hypothetical protein ACE5IM_13915 [Nitrospinota bacterium]